MTLGYWYDQLGRNTSVIDPRTGASIIHYNSQGQMDYREDPAGNRTSFGYHPDSGRQDTTTNTLGKAKRLSFNDRGQITHIWGDTESPVQYGYNDYGEKTEQRTFRGGTGWHGVSWPEGTTGTADLTTLVYQESSGLLIAKQDAKGNATTYTYYPGGRLHTRTWARSTGVDPLVTTYDYDPMTGELTDIDYSDATDDIHYTYYRHGQPHTITDALGSRERPIPPPCKKISRPSPACTTGSSPKPTIRVRSSDAQLDLSTAAGRRSPTAMNRPPIA